MQVPTGGRHAGVAEGGLRQMDGRTAVEAWVACAWRSQYGETFEPDLQLGTLGGVAHSGKDDRGAEMAAAARAEDWVLENGIATE